MNTRLIGIATLFTAGSILSAGTTTLGATRVESAGGNTELALAGCGSGSCGSKDAKKDEKSKDAKKATKKDASCGKDMKKDGKCGKDKKKDASCGANKKDEPEKK